MTTSRLLSIIVAVIDWIIIARLSPTDPATEPLAGNSLAVLAPLVLIWFCEIIGNITGPVGRGGYINVKTPGWMIAGLGWILLLIPIAIFILHPLPAASR